MAERKKPKKKLYTYYCPYCGNDAPVRLRYDRDVKCHYCRNVYSMNERVKVVIGK